MLIRCFECGNDVSSKAALCPNCGNPITIEKVSEGITPLTTSTSKPKQSRRTRNIIIALSIIGMGIFAVLLSSNFLKASDLNSYNTEIIANEILNELGVESSECNLFNPFLRQLHDEQYECRVRKYTPELTKNKIDEMLQTHQLASVYGEWINLEDYYKKYGWESSGSESSMNKYTDPTEDKYDEKYKLIDLDSVSVLITEEFIMVGYLDY